MMGPSLIFDKSALECLNVDESMWLDQYYLSNLTPLFFVETLADLEKKVRSGRSPEDIVGNLAEKTPENGCTNAYHSMLLQGELLGMLNIEMSGRPAVSEGRAVKLGNETGVIFEQTPEEEAFQRWQKHEFLDIERTLAKQWRAGLKMPSEGSCDEISKYIFGALLRPKNFDELITQIHRVVDEGREKDVLAFGLSILNVSSEFQPGILRRWESNGKKPLREFAPYFVHILTIDLFFYCGMATNLFTEFRHPQTHMVDIAYLYYLPFCNIFISNDNLHVSIAKYFLREDQTFIKGSDLKADLQKIDRHYSAFPEEVKARGVITFAMTPPDDASFMTTQMWDKYMRSTWRDMKPRKFDGTDAPIDEGAEKALTEKMRALVKDSVPISHEELGPDGAHQIIRTRKVSAVKGKWLKFPPEVINSEKRILDE